MNYVPQVVVTLRIPPLDSPSCNWSRLHKKADLVDIVIACRNLETACLVLTCFGSDLEAMYLIKLAKNRLSVIKRNRFLQPGRLSPKLGNFFQYEVQKFEP